MTLSPVRLRRLVKHRKRLEQVEERSLTEALALGRARQAVLDLSIQQRVLALSPGNFAGPEVDLAARMSGRRYIERADRLITAQRSAVEHSGREADEARDRLLQRRRDRRALEALLDRELKEQSLRRERREAIHLDEVGASIWHRSAAQKKGA